MTGRDASIRTDDGRADDDTDGAPAMVREDFSDFFARDYRSVVGLAAVLIGSHSAAEDLAQDAFAAAHRRWDEIGSYDDPGAWVRRVVANRAVSVLRRRWREAGALVRLAQRRPGPGAAGDLPDEELWAAVRGLPRRQAQCVALFYVDDRSVDDIARTLGLASSTVRVHLHDGRKRLAALLHETLEAEDGDEDDEETTT
jgi:RNA polymerase sigma-70 factor (ECF subfamily)